MDHNNDKEISQEKLLDLINKLLLLVIVLICGLIFIPLIWIFRDQKNSNNDQSGTPKIDSAKAVISYWKARDIDSVSDPVEKAKIQYGKDLIMHTAKYLGPNGTVMKISNGMNCQNCHLEAGTKVFGNNYGSVHSLYPKFRARSGSVENIYKRINDCVQRSLNGRALDTTGKEMQAIAAYINYIGSNVETGKKASGSGLKDLDFLDRTADSLKGRSVYVAKCQSCHQPGGEGLLMADNTEYIYPPLWGPGSYNDGAGLFRISNFAKYVKYNMPQGTRHENPQLTDEEAWDVAAYVNSRPRPHLDVPTDWPDRSKKPVDHPFGPYTDSFPEWQHKFGPFKAIAKAQKQREDQEAKKKKTSSTK
mgnify:CR=1 FL=1